MTIQKAIDRAYSIRPDGFSPEEKVEWLSTLDAQIFQEIILTHENPDALTFSPYSASETEQELLVPFPYDNLYLSYLKTKVEESYGETEAYNNAVYLFKENMREFKAHWNRTHMPIRNAKKRKCGGVIFVYPCESPLEGADES